MGNDKSEMTAGNHRIKVCHITSVHAPFDTRIFYKECPALVEAGYEVHLVVGRDVDDEVLNGIHIHSVPLRKSKIRRMLFTTWGVYRKALEIKADLYHFHDPELIPVALLLKIRGRKVISDVHEDYPDCINYKDSIPLFFRKPAALITGFFESLTAGFFDAIVTVTPKISARFQKLNTNTVEIRNFPLLSEFSSYSKTSGSERTDTVTYIGMISFERGIIELIQSLEIVNKTVSAHLILGGNFPFAGQEEYVRNLPGFQYTDFRGFVSRGQVTQILSEVKAGIVVTRSVSNHKHAYMTKMFEYMAAGIPVVASDFPLWRSIVEGNGCGLLVEPGNPEDIAQAIIWILNHPSEADQMGKHGRKAVEEQYNWDSEKIKLLQLYSSLSKKI
jgi:glycosyltransferase involved in cell wall biosynthesis